MKAKSSYWTWDSLMAKEIGDSVTQKQTFKTITPQKELPSISMKILQNPQKIQENTCQISPSKTFARGSSMSPAKCNKVFKSDKLLKSSIKIKRKKLWQQQIGIYKNSSIMFFNFRYDIEKIQKLKLYPQTVDNSSSFYQMKMLYKNQPILFGLLVKDKISADSVHYNWFQRILIQKMEKNAKVKSFDKKQIWSVADSLKQNLPTSSRFSGYMLKKSQYLCKWVKRWLIILNDGIHSFNTENYKETFFIPSQYIRYIWTRFETFNGMLIIKVKHGIRKTQFAIPLYDLLQGQHGFFYQLYKVMMENKTNFA